MLSVTCGTYVRSHLRAAGSELHGRLSRQQQVVVGGRPGGWQISLSTAANAVRHKT